MTPDLPSNPVEVLVVEDSPTQAERLRHILHTHGYKPSVARNGLEALTVMQERKPTLVISDIMMPEMDGYELCRRIKQAPGMGNLPVILLTSLNDPADVVKGLEAGADSFIFKPYDEEYLLARIAYTLANRHLRASEGSQMGVEVLFAGRKFFITSDRLQILNLLLSTYEAAIQKNRELVTTQDELRDLNERLEARVEERTASLATEVAERKQAQQKLHEQLTRLDLLSRTTRAISERQDLRSIFQVVIRSLEDSLGIDFSCACLYESEKCLFTVMSVGVRSRTLALDLALTENAPIPVETNGLGRAASGQLVYEPDLALVHFPFPQRLAKAGLHSFVIAPLVVGPKVFGALMIARRMVQGFSSGDLEFLRQLSEHVALATNQAQLHSDLQNAYDELRQSQHTAMQQERLRALGQMASGIAHDINNAISPVALYTESLLEREPGLSEKARNYLVTIQRAIDDVAETVSRMREFYRQREPQSVLVQIDLNRIVQQSIDLTRARWMDLPQERGVVIDVKPDLTAPLPAIMGVESEIRDALTNLIFNAVDAMQQGGTVTLRTRAVNTDGQPAAPDSAASVHLEVVDTGIGMDEETKRRCLEPFYTTKGERGTGLGLAMVYGMVQRHGAQIKVDTTPRQGTTMRIEFPVCASASGLTPSVTFTPPPPVRKMNLLIIDDDPLLIQSLRDILEGDGHHITSADGGQAGIDTFKESVARNEPFEAVITDLGMPYVDGRTVAAAIKAASPKTPVFLLTGWGQRLIEESDVPPHVDRVMNKPPKLRELRIALGEVIAKA